MDWFSKSLNLAYFKSKDKPLSSKYSLWRGVAQSLNLSPGARLKLEWIIFYQTVGKSNVLRTARHFGISRKTLHKWLKRFEERNLRSLEEKSRAPIKKRSWEVNLVEQERIITLRKAHLKYGKRKLKVIYLKEFGEEISTWKIERVIRTYNLYPDSQAYTKLIKKRAQSRANPKVRIQEVTKQERFGFLWHLDAIIIWWYGTRRVIFTAMEEYTKIAYARVYSTNKSGYAEDFLKRLMYLVEGEVEIIHSDNGSEFEGTFKKACHMLNIKQVFSRSRMPEDNPALERFNWTVQDEWLSLSEVGLDNIDDANRDLTSWLIEYNNVRPHETLDYLTPLEYAQKYYFKVLPMWSASTRS